ncbi:MAG: GWxTD domain-containing protein [Candidatus Aminicenantes bacterium]|nr:GWxTD domain-containing protein [Candidatus Aminicenantes bacterium]
MKRKLTISVLIIAAAIALYGDKKEKTDNLPPAYEKWLNEEVVYIITPREKEVFLKLQTDRERDLFIEAFWSQRDILHSTPKGESKKEHYRRLNYVDHFFGRGTPKPGWRTDRGRTYIILGEPNDTQRFEGKTQTYPTEVWFYQGKTHLGLPPGFNLVFYQESFTGEYRLYSPARDGPQALLTSYYGDPMDYLAAYQQLREFEPDLAEVSLSLIPGEGNAITGRPSLSSDILIQRVETVPVREIKDRYAQKFLEYKDIVEVEYSTNYIGNDSSVKVIKDSSGIYFVHYAIEPERLSVDSFENKYYTTLKVNGTVSNLEDKIIYQFGKDFSLNFDEEKLKSISRQPLSLRDMFPLIPGSYKLSILVKNEASKEFTSIERTLIIPQEEDALQMTSLILGYNMKKDEKQQGGLRPFQIGKSQIYFHANRIFVRQDTMVAAFQLHGINQALREKGEIRFTVSKDEEEFRTSVKKITEYPDLPNILEQFSLREFMPAHYRIRVSLFVDGREVLSESEDFDVTYAEAVVRPWIYSKVLAEVQDPVYSFIIGTQLYNSGKTAEARDSLEKAFQKNQNSVDFALNLARAYLTLAEYKKIESVLLPFLNQPEPPQYELFFILGKAYQNLGELDKAIDIFDKALSHYGLNVNLLNSLGECYFQLGSLEGALAAWEKSLEINPDQPEIQKSVKVIKEKK